MKIVELQDIDNSLRLDNQDVEEIIKLAEERVKEKPNLRMGQCLYNWLFIKHPELARNVMDTTADPFYDDNNINRFLKAITKI